MNWSEQYPKYHERLAIMEEDVYFWLTFWKHHPEAEPTLARVDRCPNRASCNADQVCIWACNTH